MEEIEELRAKALASMSVSANPNSKLKDKPIGTREEGELSSSDGDEIPTSSAGQATNIAMLSVEPSYIASGSISTERFNLGKSVSVNGPASSGHIQRRTSVKQNYSKHFEMNPLQSKSGNHHTPGWYVPSTSTNNLVISFSDDDSGSDSAEYKQERTSDRKNKSHGVDGFKRPPVSSQSKSEILRQTANNKVKMIPKKVSLSRTFISSMKKIHGANSGGSGSSSVEQGSRVRSLNPASKATASREHGYNQGMTMNNNNLESLRQQIAIRENELKLQLKSGQQSKEMISGSSREYDGTKPINNEARKSRLTTANTVQLAPNEQGKKRLKLNEPTRSKLNSDSQLQLWRPATKSVSDLKMPVMGNNGHNNSHSVTYSQHTKETVAGTTDAGISEQQRKADEQVLSSENLTGVKDGGSSVPFLETISSTVPNFEFSNKQETGSLSDTGIFTSCGQSAKSNKLCDSLTVLTQSSGLAQMTAGADGGVACQLKMPSPKKLNTEGSKHPSSFGGTRSSTIFQNKGICQDNLVSSEYNELTSGDGTLKPSSDNPCDGCFRNYLESKLCTSDVNFSGHNSMDMQSFVKIEELQDKELEEAQEHRRMCEIEERNALKAYRKAQRALVEANARCTYLYRRREWLSAQFQAFAMEDSNSVWTSRWQKHMEIGVDSSHIFSEAHLDLLPTSGHPMQTGFGVLNRLGCDSNIHCTNGVVNTYHQNMSGQNLGSEPSEPDASTSELLHHKDNSAANGVCTPSINLNMSADEDEETFPFDHKAVQSRLECDNKEENLKRREMGISDRSERKYTIDSTENPALLEASLRSELFARLGNKALLKNSGLGYSKECTVEKGADTDVENEATSLSMRNQALLETEQNQVSDTGGTDNLGRTTRELSLQIQEQCHGDKCSFDSGSHRTGDPDESSSSLIEACRSTASASCLPSSDLSSAFGHLKLPPPISFREFSTKDQQAYTYNIAHGEDTVTCSNDILLDILRVHSTVDTIRGIGGVGSYTCDLSIDPFWPLCMFELRGKCNNGECSWQHSKDYSQRNVEQLEDSSSSDNHFGPLSHCKKSTGACKLLHHHIKSGPLTYLVGSDLLKADLLSYESVLGQSIGQCWQKGFSTSMAVPFSLQKDLPSDVPFLHGNDGRIEVHQSWNRKSLYFQRQDEAMKQLKQGLVDPEQSLDMAITLFNQESNKPDGNKKVLYVLSRALETDPTSVGLWVVYLHIFYMNEKAIGTDDMFLHSIHHNEGSYELWLIYINTRVQLDDRLLAYETALSALCRHASAPDRDTVHTSACILDLFLQMMDFLCMSGNVGKVFPRIYAFLLPVTDSNETCSVLLSDILACLTISDKCIFWVCCVYLVMYRKLPNAVVQQFECEKELPFDIEWPSIQLTPDEKHQVVKLMEMALGSVACHINGGLHEKESALRSAHLLSLSHVWCLAALKDLDWSKILLEKYLKQYPTCLELVLTSARLQKECSLDIGFEGFEEALRSWPKGIPGTECIWNQYVQYALENGRADFAKELMIRWFQSVWKIQYAQNGKSDASEDDLHISSGSPSSSIPDDCFAFSNTKDKLFGLLNLSLYRFLQNDQTEARLAIDRALKVAAPEDFKLCVREHAMFLCTDRSQSMEDVSASGILSLLNTYLVDARSFMVSEPLSRKFLRSIKKPRVRQLISSILGPISFDCSLVNLVLDVWYGPSLLPEKLGKLKDLVDFVEAIMEILPANYWLALSICKLISRNSNSAGLASASVVFWASSLLVNSFCQAVPVAPEYIWVEAAGILGNLVEVHGISERFYQRALSVHPFSIKLWRSYFNLSKMTGNMSAVVEAARKRGIILD